MTRTGWSWSVVQQSLLSFPEQNPPALLAHYTSLSALEGILRDQKLWFSHPLLMNDSEEMRFGLEEGAKLFRASSELRDACGGSREYDHLQMVFADRLESFFKEHARDIFVFCMSAHGSDEVDGRLSMWRGYGDNGGGAALVFRGAALDRMRGSPVWGMPVQYGSAADRLGRLQARLAILTELISNWGSGREVLSTCAIGWLEYLKVFAITEKHSGFAEEQEWRLVYVKEFDREQKLVDAIDYALTSRGIEPKFKLGFAQIAACCTAPRDAQDLVDGVLLGPAQSSELAVTAAKRMTVLLGLPELESRVRASAIPFRARHG